jgi:hypothetical protein
MWLKAKKLWLKRKKDCDYYQKKKDESSQPKLKNPMKDVLFPYSLPYKSTFPFEGVYQQTSTGNGISMDPQKVCFVDTQVP